MSRRFLFAAFALAAALALLDSLSPNVPAQGKGAGNVQWIWFDEGDPVTNVPASTRYFRRVFTIDRDVQKPVDEAALDIPAATAYRVWVNGAEVGSGNDWKTVKRYDVQKHLKHGKNVIAVECKNTAGPAGLLVRLGYVPNGLSKTAVVSDKDW